MTTPSTSSAASPEPADYRLDEQVGYLLRTAHQRHRAIFSRGIGAKIAPTQFAVLARLRIDGPTSQNELGRRTAMDSATIAGVIDRLIRRDLVVVAPSPNDERLSIVDLTEGGAALVAELIPRAVAISAETVAPLDPAEVALLLTLLARIADA